MIKLVHIITGLNTGGAEMMLYKLLSKMDRRFFSSSVVSLTNKGTIGPRMEEIGIPVYETGMTAGVPGLRDIWKFIAIIRHIKPHIMQGWMYHGNLAATIGSFFCGRPPVCWNIRQSLCSLSYEKRMTAAVVKLGSYLSWLPDRIVFNSEVSAGQHETIGYRTPARVLIPNGFDIDSFVPSDEAGLSLRRELGLAGDVFIIGLIGRYHPMKDHSNFMRAASLLLKEPDVYFIMAGKRVDERNNALRKEINELGLANRVRLLGERTDLARLTAGLDIAVSSSSYAEGFPNVIGEAMSCGVPCVVTDIGDSAWIVGDAGTAVQPRDPESMARAWQELIDMKEEQRREIGRRGRQRIVEKFSLNAIVQEYEELYKKVLVHQEPSTKERIFIANTSRNDSGQRF